GADDDRRPQRPGRHPAAPQQVVDADGVTWQVRQVAAGGGREADGRSYLCPGCQQQIPATSAHTVAWPVDAMQGLANRRHWHTTCWQARDRRRPGGAWA
ncbi:hypothetical protein, partial [Ornithinicoccus halotolerans]|uniref:hypothetical protein n=1 Tax=Ornithinicoccus halotolerans TaxID=1748220 RepID=UPI001885F4C0